MSPNKMIQLPLSANPTLPLQATKTRLRYHLQSWALRSSALPNEEERRASCQWTSAAPRTMASWKSALDKQDLPHLWFGTQTCLWRLQEWSRPGMTDEGSFVHHGTWQHSNRSALVRPRSMCRRDPKGPFELRCLTQNHGCTWSHMVANFGLRFGVSSCARDFPQNWSETKAKTCSVASCLEPNRWIAPSAKSAMSWLQKHLLLHQQITLENCSRFIDVYWYNKRLKTICLKMQRYAKIQAYFFSSICPSSTFFVPTMAKHLAGACELSGPRYRLSLD